MVLYVLLGHAWQFDPSGEATLPHMIREPAPSPDPLLAAAREHLAPFHFPGPEIGS